MVFIPYLHIDFFSLEAEMKEAGIISKNAWLLLGILGGCVKNNSSYYFSLNSSKYNEPGKELKKLTAQYITDQLKKMGYPNTIEGIYLDVLR